MSVHTWHEIRYQCPQCGRIVAESAITTTDYRDDDTYYGFATTWSIDCSRCGHIDDLVDLPHVPIREMATLAGGEGE